MLTRGLCYIKPCGYDIGTRFVPPEPTPTPDFTYEMDRQTDDVESGFLLAFSATGQTGFVDWGDGSAIESFDTAGAVFTELYHTYGSAGIYTMKLFFDDISTWQYFQDNLSGDSEAVEAVWLTEAPAFIYFVAAKSRLGALPTFPASITNISIDNSLMTAADLSPYTNLVDVSITVNANLGSVDASGLTNMTSLNIGDNPVLNTLDITGSTGIINLVITFCAFSTTSVSSYLVSLDGFGQNNGNVAGGDQTPVASLNAGGVAAKASLEGKGWSISVDV